jgi:hypothetical protein
MTTNPSHILIARNSRGPSNATAALSSPTETHAAAAGIFRSSAGSPPWFLEGADTEDAISELSITDSQEPIDVDEAFTKHSKFPGTVKIVVESTTFWCVSLHPILFSFQVADAFAFGVLLLRAHKEVLWFASPFFQAALSGNWAETGRPLSMSSVITISQPPVVPGDKIHPDAPTAMAFAPMDPDMDPEELDIDVSESSEPEVIESSRSPTPADAHGTELGARSESGGCTTTPKRKSHEAARQESLEKLLRAAALPGDAPRHADKEKANQIVKLSWKRANASAKHQQVTSNPDAVIVLKEEKARFSSFFLGTCSHSRSGKHLS